MCLRFSTGSFSFVGIAQKWLGASCGPEHYIFDWFLYSFCMLDFQSFTHIICCITMIQQIDNNSLVEKYTWNVNQFNWRKWFVWQSQWWYILGINVLRSQKKCIEMLVHGFPLCNWYLFYDDDDDVIMTYYVTGCYWIAQELFSSFSSIILNRYNLYARASTFFG